MKKFQPILFLGLLLMSSVAFSADWQIDNAASQLSFISVKKTHIAEVHQFETLSGGVTDAGQITVEIDLNSVNTGIEIRDNRMREFLFDVVSFPTAIISGQVELSFLDTLDIGQSAETSVDATLSLHGETASVALDMLVTKLSEQQLLVTSVKPVILNVTDFALVAGVEKLQELAGLPSISLAVPVSFYLTLNAK